MHAGLQNFLNTRSTSATQTVVDSKTTTLTGNLNMAQLEDLLRIAMAHNARIELVAGALKVLTN
jgi:hypothetical protein